MIQDKFGHALYQIPDLVNLIYSGNIQDIPSVLVEPNADTVQFEQESGIQLRKIEESQYHKTVAEFDEEKQKTWLIPTDYLELDVLQFCLQRCSNSTEQQRVLDEMAVFEQKGMIPVLQTLKYLVDAFRENQVLWGVGRGSSVASYVLYLIGVHRIDSVKYNLDWREFLR